MPRGRGYPQGTDPRLLPRLPGTPPPRLTAPQASPVDAAMLQAQRGLLGAQPPPTPKTTKEKLLGRGNVLDRLFDTDEGGRQGGLLAAGAALLKSSRPRPKGTGSFAANLGEAIEAGRGGAALGQQQAAQRTSTERRAAIFNQFKDADMTDPGTLREMFSVMVAAGEFEGAKPIAEVLKSMESGGGTPQIKTGINPETGEPAYFRISPEGGAPELIEGASPIPPAGRASQLRTVVAPGGGATYHEWDPETGEWKATGIQAPSQPGEQERRAEFFSSFLPTAELNFAAFDEKAPPRIGSIAQEIGLREITSPEIQALHIGGNMYSEAWLRMTTGAAYNEMEFRNSFRMFVPMPGDKRETLQLKKQARTLLRESLNRARGRAAYSSGGMNPSDILPGGLYDKLKESAEQEDATGGLDLDAIR